MLKNKTTDKHWKNSGKQGKLSYNITAGWNCIYYNKNH